VEWLKRIGDSSWFASRQCAVSTTEERKSEEGRARRQWARGETGDGESLVLWTTTRASVDDRSWASPVMRVFYGMPRRNWDETHQPSKVARHTRRAWLTNGVAGRHRGTIGLNEARHPLIDPKVHVCCLHVRILLSSPCGTIRPSLPPTGRSQPRSSHWRTDSVDQTTLLGRYQPFASRTGQRPRFG
jgi:hypothetical protein